MSALSGFNIFTAQPSVQFRRNEWFYFQYDGIDASAKCVRTWGDGGIYDHVITYDTQKRITLVENSLGENTLYQMDEAGQVVSVTDPAGRVTAAERSGGRPG